MVESWMSLGRSRPQVGPGRWTGPFGALDQKTRSRPAAGTYFLPEPEEIQSSLAKTMQHWASRRPPCRTDVVCRSSAGASGRPDRCSARSSVLLGGEICVNVLAALVYAECASLNPPRRDNRQSLMGWGFQRHASQTFRLPAVPEGPCQMSKPGASCAYEILNAHVYQPGWPRVSTPCSCGRRRSRSGCFPI